MNYKLLKTTYHKNREQYNELYQKRFYGEETIHLPVNIGDSPAFYLITDELLNTIYDIVMLNTDIALIDLQLPPAAKDQFVKSCLINEIDMTNKMEGVHSSRKEIGDILNGVRGTKNESRLLGLVNKYLFLIKGYHDEIKNCTDIRKLFDDLVAEEVAKENPKEIFDGTIFRKDSVSVYSETQAKIHTGLYPEEKIISVMESSIGILNDKTKNRLIRIALFHYLFGYIHPFYNGNGRVNRFISSALLSNELNPYICYQLSQTIKNNKNKYYDAFEICNHDLNKGDLTPFLIMFLKIVKKAAVEIKENLELKYCDLTHYLEIIKTLSFEKKEKEFLSLVLQATLFSFDGKGITMNELIDHMECSRSTITNRISDINKMAKFIVINDTVRPHYYKLDLELLDQLHS